MPINLVVKPADPKIYCYLQITQGRKGYQDNSLRSAQSKEGNLYRPQRQRDKKKL